MLEAELIKQAQQGDDAAFETLIESHERRIYNIAYKFMGNDADAQDAAQEAIIKMYHNMNKYSFRAAFTTWMYRVIVNTCLDLKRKKKDEISFETQEYMAASTHGNPDADLLSSELKGQIKHAVRLLPEKYMTILVLIDIEGLKYEETAEILDMSVGTVKSRLSRAREKLRELLVKQKILA